MKIERSIYRHFGRPKPEGLTQTTTNRKINTFVHDAVTDAHWIAVHGPIMAGKTAAVGSALRKVQKKTRKNIRYVNLYWPDRRGITISEVLNQMIYTLGEEYIGRRSPRRGKEIRMYQVLDILIEAKSRGHHVVLQIDEAHELHGMTIKALKRLWEYDYKGESDLLTILLVGQPKLEHKIKADREVRKRCYLHEMKYKPEEKAIIAKHHASGLINNEIAATLADRLEQPGDIVYAIRKALLRCIKLDKERPELDDFTLPKQREQRKKEKPKRVKVDSSQLDRLEKKYGKGVADHG